LPQGFGVSESSSLLWIVSPMERGKCSQTRVQSFFSFHGPDGDSLACHCVTVLPTLGYKNFGPLGFPNSYLCQKVIWVCRRFTTGGQGNETHLFFWDLQNHPPQRDRAQSRKLVASYGNFNGYRGQAVQHMK